MEKYNFGPFDVEPDIGDVVHVCSYGLGGVRVMDVGREGRIVKLLRTRVEIATKNGTFRASPACLMLLNRPSGIDPTLARW